MAYCDHGILAWHWHGTLSWKTSPLLRRDWFSTSPSVIMNCLILDNVDSISYSSWSCQKCQNAQNSSQLQQNQEMIFAEEEDVGGQQEVVQGDDCRGSQDAWLQLQILLSQVLLDKSFVEFEKYTSTHSKLSYFWIARQAWNFNHFLCPGGSPTVSRRVRSSETTKTFTSEDLH